MPDRFQQRGDLLAARRARGPARCSRSGSPTIWPIDAARVEARVRILEDDLDEARDLAALAGAGARDVAPGEHGCVPAGGLVQAHEAARERGLAAARLADHGERLARRAARTTRRRARARWRAGAKSPPRTGKCFTRSIDLEQRCARSGAALLRRRARTPCATKQATGRRRASSRPAPPRGSRAMRVVATRREAAAARHLERRRHGAADLAQQVAVAAPPTATPSSARACTDAAAPGRSPRLLPSSTLRPAYITTTRCGGLGDHAEVVRDQQHRHAEAVP